MNDDYETLMKLVDRAMKNNNYLAATVYLLEARKIRKELK